MKYVILLGDGMADRPIKELGGRTPLQAALTPNMDSLAGVSICGSLSSIPKGFDPGSDVANMSILGYNPREYYTGRSPLEAASMGIPLLGDDVAFRCNLVTIRFDKASGKGIMEDYSAGHISTNDATVLVDLLDEKLVVSEGETVKFYPGISYRHLMIWENGEVGTTCTPPHDILDKPITDHLPLGPGNEFLNSLMRSSVDLLQKHPINRHRLSEGKNPANSIWLWGQGRKPKLPHFRKKFGIEGSVVSAVDLVKGLGICAGLKSIDVPGATGYLDTNYEGKAQYALESLKERDFVYLHVEAPDEAGHMGSHTEKIKAIEDFDSNVVGTVMRGLKSLGDHKILLLPDHATPVSLRTHTDDPVPFLLYDSTNVRKSGVSAYDENILKTKGIYEFPDGHKLMDFFIKNQIS